MAHIRHMLTINAPLEKVYDAISSTEGLSAWWTPKVDRENNNLIFHFGPDYSKTMKIEHETKENISWKCIEAHPEWIDTIIHFNLTEKEENTELLFAHDNWSDYTEMYAICNFNWALFLRSLRKLCETGAGNPHPDQIDI